MAKRTLITPGMLVKPKANRYVSMWREMVFSNETQLWSMSHMNFVFLCRATCVAVPGRFGARSESSNQGAALLMIPSEKLDLFWVWADHVMAMGD